MYSFKELSLDYNILPPLNAEEKDSQTKPPLLLLLHGFGANKDDLFSFANMLDKKYLIVAAQAPYEVYMPGSRAWYNLYINGNEYQPNNEEAMESLSKLKIFIEELKSEFEVEEVNLLGFSQGAILSYALALSQPEKYNKVFALSGYVDENLIDLSGNIDELNKLELFISHGSFDDVIPLKKAKDSYSFLDNNKIGYEAFEYEMGHGINEECLNEIINRL